MSKANSEIREALKKAGIPVWRLAHQLGVHENTVLRHLRLEMTDEEKNIYLSAISDIAKEKTV